MSVNLMSAVFARQNLGERSHEETLHRGRCARRGAWDLAKHSCKLKNAGKATFHSSIEAKVMLAPTSKSPEEGQFLVDSGASMHTVSKKDLNSDGLVTLRRSGNPTVVFTAIGEVHTNEEAQIYDHDLNLFVTVQLLEETPAVLSLGKLCEDHGYSYEWVSGQRPRLTKEEKTSICKTDNFVPLVVPVLSTNSGGNSSSTSTLQDLSSTSPAQERSDGPVPGDWCGSPQKPKTNQIRKRDGNRDSDDRLRDLPAWLVEFLDTCKIQKCLHPHTFLTTQIRNVL